ncbi:MAG: FtsX-like permease family protein [Planctomycetes bacterium]|nr:FtsX-like permease family protein [Planctomycetota bacterium]
MLKLLLWLKYLCKRKLVLLSIAAVALSVALLIVVASLFSGFIQAYEQTAEDMIGDVLLQTYVPFGKAGVLADCLEALPEVDVAVPVMLTPGLLHVGEGHVRYVQVFGLDETRLSRMPSLKRSLRHKSQDADLSFDVPAHPEDTGGFVGVGLLSDSNEVTDQYDFGLADEFMGDRLFLTSGTMDHDTAETQAGTRSPRTRTLRFRVSDIVFAGHSQFDREAVYLPLKALYEALHQTEEVKVQRVQIRLADGVDPVKAIDVMEGQWAAFERDHSLSLYHRFHTAKELQADYMQELNKQMAILLSVFSLVDVGVIFLIFCIFYMIVRLKRKDIGVIKSCGCSSCGVVIIFLGFGVFVGVVGSVFGIGLGYLFTHNINTIEQWIAVVFGLNLWDSTVYLFSAIPNRINWASAAQISAFAVIAASIGALIPAILAGRMQPVDILRYE